MSDNLHFYTHLTKEKIKLSNKALASGGEGALYAIASPRNYGHLVAKIYFPEKRTKEREAKMKYLIQNPPVAFNPKEHLSIVWVLDIIYLDNKFVGILMKRAEGKKLTKLTLAKLPKKADEAWHRFAFGQFDATKLRLRTCFNIAVVIHLIHRSERYVLVDLKPDNILMQPNGLISLVDMDSVEVVENGMALFPAPVATPEYTPPEFYTQDRTVIEESWDRFSLAVIFYQLLFGLHPFAASAKVPYDNLVALHDKIKAGLYVHHPNKEHVFSIIPPPHLDFYKAPLEIQDLFQQCFDSGHEIPEARPSAEDWCATLAMLLNLPFDRLPNLGFPPSNLYFLPSESPRISALFLGLPSISEKNASHFLLQKHHVKQIDTVSPTTWITPTVKKYYDDYVKEYKNLFSTHLALIVVFSVIFVAISPWLLTISLLLLLAALGTVYFRFNNNLISRIIPIALKSSGLENIIDEKKEYEQKLKDQSAIINESIHNINTHLQQMDAKKLKFIRSYFENRVNYEAKLTELNTWINNSEEGLKKARLTELDGYKKIDLETKELQKKNSAIRSFSVITNQKRQLIKRQEQLQKKLASLGSLKDLLQEQLQQKLTEAKELFEKNCASHQQEATLSIKEKIKNFKDTVVKTPNQKELDYKKYLTECTQLKYDYNKKSSKLNKTLHNFMRASSLGLNIKSEKKLDFLFKKIIELPKEQDYHSVKNLVAQRVKNYTDQLNSISEANPSLATSLNLVSTKLSTITQCNVEEPITYLKNVRSTQELHSKMISTQKQVEGSFDILSIQLEKFINAPILNSSVDLAYWVNEIAKSGSLVQSQLQELLQQQEQFFKYSIVVELQKRVHDFNLLEPNIQKQLEALSKEESLELEQLKTTYKDAIEYHENPSLALENLDLKLKTYKAILEEEQATVWEVYEQNQKDLLEQTVKDLQHEFKTKLELHQQQAEEDFHNIKTEEKQIQQQIAQIEIECQNFESKLAPIRTEAEKVYKYYLEDFEQLLQELEPLLAQIVQDHPIVEQYLSEQQLIINMADVYSKGYTQALDTYQKFEEDKIKIDSLLEWQKQRSRLTLIKDILTNKNQLD